MDVASSEFYTDDKKYDLDFKVSRQPHHHRQALVRATHDAL
jgi:enolase